jgi:imidazole glycerol-phosphate synthase subunit HisH
MLVIVDYGLSNVHSIYQKLHMEKIEVIISSNKDIISKATKIILPGVGHFKTAMYNLEKYALLDILIEKIKKDNVPILGICLGMQLLTNFSEEGNCNGLGLIKAKTIKFDDNLKVPNVGWHKLETIKSNILLNDIDINKEFYFTHSFYVECKKNDIVSFCNYENKKFVAAFSKNNIYGVQFHPEKSHYSGFKLIKNFILYA